MATLHDECRDAARAAATLLESLGHHVEHGFPAALANRDFGRRFSALWSTNMGVAVHRIESQLGRPLSDDDVEPVNRAQVAFARGVSAVDYALALAAAVEFRRAVQQWWADGWDLLLTPTLAEPPAPLGTFANDPTAPDGPDGEGRGLRAVHSGVQLQRPTGHQPAAPLEQFRLADRRAAGGRLRPRRPVVEGGIAGRDCPAVGTATSPRMTFGPGATVPVV